MNYHLTNFHKNQHLVRSFSSYINGIHQAEKFNWIFYTHNTQLVFQRENATENESWTKQDLVNNCESFSNNVVRIHFHEHKFKSTFHS